MHVSGQWAYRIDRAFAAAQSKVRGGVCPHHRGWQRAPIKQADLQPQSTAALLSCLR
eukprot:COSAG01_NODE_45060_length_413_cov_0.592357_1_plen_56_part_01